MLSEFYTNVIIFLLGILIGNVRQRSNKFPPGPTRIPFLGSFPVLTLKKPINVGLCELSKIYGPIFSIYLGNYPAIVLSDLKVIKEAFKSDKFNGRPQLRPVLERSWGLPIGLAFSNGETWSEQRRFAMKSLKDFGVGRRTMENLICDDVTQLVENFKKQVGHPIKISANFNIAALNSLWHILSGKKYSHDDPAVTKLLEQLLTLTEQHGAQGAFYFMPWLTKLFPNLSGYNESMAKINLLKDFAMKETNEHKKRHEEFGNQCNDFIDAYLQEIKQTINPESSFHKSVGEKSLVLVLFEFVLAGADTTATTLSWGILYSMLYPRIQTKLHKEIQSVIGSERSPSLSDRPSMPYMEAFINETLRMSSITPLSIFRCNLETIQFGGFTIPKDTIVLPNLWQVHHDKEYWGDPENFRPERFINNVGGFVRDDAVIPFSIGKRSCMGEGLARDQLFLFFTFLFQNFTFEIDPNEPPPKMKSKDGLVVKPNPYKTIIKLNQFST